MIDSASVEGNVTIMSYTGSQAFRAFKSHPHFITIDWLPLKLFLSDNVPLVQTSPIDSPVFEYLSS